MCRGILEVALRGSRLGRMTCGLLAGALVLVWAGAALAPSAADARGRDKRRWSQDDDSHGGGHDHDNFGNGSGGQSGGGNDSQSSGIGGNGSGNGKGGQDDDKGSAGSASDKDAGDGQSQKSSRATGGASDGDGSDGPPRTLFDMMKRAFQGAPEEDRGKHAAGKAALAGARSHWDAKVKPAEGKKKSHDRKLSKGHDAASRRQAADAGKAQERQRSARGRMATVVAVQPAPDAIRSDVLLGLELSPKAFAVAQRLGMRPVFDSDGEFGRITEFSLPSGYDAFSAREMLQSELPAELFVYSIRYHLVPQGEAAAKPSAYDRSAIAGGVPGKPCEGDRCYASQLVGWRPNLASCSTRVRVGVVDTAVDVKHPSLIDMRSKMGTFGRGSVADASNWHGTGVAALLAGAAQSATPGLIPKTEFLLADIFTRHQDGSLESDTMGLASALEWLDMLGVNVVNLSISGARDPLVEEKVRSMSSRGVVLVAAAGNDGPDGTPSYPAAYKPVIAVTAVNRELNSYQHATQGSYIDVAAPGVRIWTALPDGRMGYRTGTSFAAPFVTSIIASIYASTPVKTKAALLHRLTYKDLGPPGRDPIFGRGLLVAPEACVPAVVAAPVAAARQHPPIKNALQAP